MTEKVALLGDAGSVCGIMTGPVGPSRGGNVPAVVFVNAGLTHRIGPHRIHVQLARRLSRGGVTSLRLDLSGVGDSEPRRDHLPPREGALREIHEAMDYLTGETGLQHFVLFGICSGADLAFRVGRADSRVVGLVLVNGYAYRTAGFFLRRYGRRLLRYGRHLVRPRSWLDVLQGKHQLWQTLMGEDTVYELTPDLGLYRRPPQQEADADIGSMLDRGVQLCAVHNRDRTYNHRSQFERAFPSARGSHQVTVEYMPFADHTFTLLAAQDRLGRNVENWILGTDWSPRIRRGTLPEQP